MMRGYNPLNSIRAYEVGTVTNVHGDFVTANFGPFSPATGVQQHHTVLGASLLDAFGILIESVQQSTRGMSFERFTEYNRNVQAGLVPYQYEPGDTLLSYEDMVHGVFQRKLMENAYSLWTEALQECREYMEALLTDAHVTVKDGLTFVTQEKLYPSLYSMKVNIETLDKRQTTEV